MIKLKTQLTAVVSQKDMEGIIQDMISNQLGTDTVFTDAVFNWGADSVTVTGTQQNVLKVDTVNTLSKAVPKLEPEEIMKEPVTAMDSPFTPIVKESVFTKVAAAKEAIGISTESNFPSVTPNKFQLQ